MRTALILVIATACLAACEPASQPPKPKTADLSIVPEAVATKGSMEYAPRSAA